MVSVVGRLASSACESVGSSSILEEEKVQKENGYQTVSDDTFCEDLLSFLTLVLTTVLNLAASLRFTKYILPASKIGIITRMGSIPARVYQSQSLFIIFLLFLID